MCYWGVTDTERGYGAFYIGSTTYLVQRVSVLVGPPFTTLRYYSARARISSNQLQAIAT